MKVIEFEATAKPLGTSTAVIIPAYLVHKHNLKGQHLKITIQTEEKQWVVKYTQMLD